MTNLPDSTLETSTSYKIGVLLNSSEDNSANAELLNLGRIWQLMDIAGTDDHLLSLLLRIRMLQAEIRYHLACHLTDESVMLVDNRRTEAHIAVCKLLKLLREFCQSLIMTRTSKRD